MMVSGKVFASIFKHWRVGGSGYFGNCPDINLRVVLRRCPGAFR